MNLCVECGKGHDKPKARYCCALCCQRAYFKRKYENRIKVCILCGKKHNTKKSVKYCSSACRNRNDVIRATKRERDRARIRRGFPLDHPRLIAEKGKGHRCTSRGYIVVSKVGHPNARNKNGSIYEHILVMSEHLKRPLRKGESVHHKNGLRSDNRIENLELWSKMQPSGQRLEDKIDFAKKLFQEYGYIVKYRI